MWYLNQTRSTILSRFLCLFILGINWFTVVSSVVAFFVGSDQTVRSICEKNNSFRPFIRSPWSDLAKNFIGSLFPYFPFLCHVSPISVQFPGRHTLYRLLVVNKHEHIINRWRLQFSCYVKGAIFNYLLLPECLPVLVYGVMLIGSLHQFQGDIIAGITVGLTVIPQSLAYAKIAELPPQVFSRSVVINIFVCHGL